MGRPESQYIDPLTGLAIKRITAPNSAIPSSSSKALFNYYRDIAGSWTNPANAITNQNASTLASSSAAGARLFLAWSGLDANTAATYGQQATPLDLRLRVYGYGAGSAILGACLSIDSTTCNTPPQNIPLPASTASEVDFPSNYPTAMFAGWGQAAKPISLAAFANRPSFTVNVSGSTITWKSGGINFLNDWPVGAKIKITGGGASCPGNVATIAAISPFSATVSENCGSATGAAAQYYGGGVLVWLASGSSANVSFTYDAVVGSQYFGGTNASVDVCNFNPITDINTDRNGNPVSPSQTGYLCNFNASLYLFIPATRRSSLDVVVLSAGRRQYAFTGVFLVRHGSEDFFCHEFREQSHVQRGADESCR